MKKLLGPFGLSVESVVEEAMTSRMDEIERHARMIAIAEQRTTGALREVEGRRAQRAAELQPVSSKMKKGAEGNGPEGSTALQEFTAEAPHSASA